MRVCVCESVSLLCQHCQVSWSLRSHGPYGLMAMEAHRDVLEPHKCPVCLVAAASWAILVSPWALRQLPRLGGKAGGKPLTRVFSLPRSGRVCD